MMKSENILKKPCRKRFNNVMLNHSPPLGVGGRIENEIEGMLG